MHYKYKAADKAGKIREGDLNAPNESDVISFLTREGLTPISIRTVTAKRIVLGRWSFEKITLEDKIFLTKYLALMLRVGTDLFRAIDILIEDFEKPILKEFLFEIKSNLERGNQFYLAFQNHPEFFSEATVNLIKAAEGSGSLEASLERISQDFAKEADLKSRIKSALTYPILLLIAATLVVMLLVTFVLPKIASVFAESGAKIPLYSRIVLGIGLFLNKYFIFIALPVLVGAGVLTWYFVAVPSGKKAFRGLLNRVPVVRELVKKVGLARFASTLSSLLHAGIPMVESIEITARAVGNEDLAAALLRIGREKIARGVSIGDSFRGESVFPRVVTNLVAIGEKAGRLEEVLVTLAEFYTSEIDSALKSLVSFIEPILLLGIGLVVGAIALSVIMPIYQLVAQY
jgi:type II secretory pathway component PulF